MITMENAKDYEKKVLEVLSSCFLQIFSAFFSVFFLHMSCLKEFYVQFVFVLYLANQYISKNK